MKTLLLMCTLAVLVLDSHTAVVRAPVSRANLVLGYVAPGDRLLTRQYVYQPAIPNTVQYQDVVYRGNYTTRITAILASEVGGPQWGTATLVGGGIGRSNATVRVQSARGYGYYYAVDIWGR